MSAFLVLASSLLIVVSAATNAKRSAHPDWEGAEWGNVVDALAAKHADAKAEIATVASVTNSLQAIRKVRPRYIAFVMRSEELDEPTVRALHKIVREVDDDPFDDAIWGIVTGPTAEAALRIATSHEPAKLTTALATTGIDMDIVPGPVTMLSDAYPAGVWKAKEKVKVGGEGEQWKIVGHHENGDMSHAFAFGWNDDPELIVTSSHATERNLEMPFSRGNLMPKDGRFAVTCGLPLSEPKREKIWIAAGNCLIANPWPLNIQTSKRSNAQTPSMLMTALGWGKVNQFVGYTVETWFGEIGWNTWRYFNAYRMPLNLCWYAANQNLMRTLLTTKLGTQELRGKEWDMDGTAFYGDPMQAVALPPLKNRPKWTPDALPLLLFDPAEIKSLPKDWEVFLADDFALVTKWSD